MISNQTKQILVQVLNSVLKFCAVSDITFKTLALRKKQAEALIKKKKKKKKNKQKQENENKNAKLNNKKDLLMLLLCPWNPFLSLLLSWAGRGRSLSGDGIGLSKPIIGKGMAIPIQCEW